jgi:predicted Zn-ribbon and HTH transcriptional regulator
MSTSQPEPDVSVDMAARERALAWLQEQWTEDSHCPICNTDNWAVGDPVELPVRGGSMAFFQATGQRAYVLTPVQCTKCFYTFFINAILAGIVPRS